MKTSREPRSLIRDVRGIAAVEFGLIAPVFMTVLLGTMDLGHTLYVKALLQGSVQKAARDSSLQTGTLSENQTTIDAIVTEQVKRLNKDAVVTVTRRSYYTYTEASAATPEDFTDTPSDPDNICNNNEPYVDLNGNDTWDADGAVDGQGGARDKAVYTVNMKYPRLLPINKFIPGMSADIDISASTVLANQPYGEQQVITSNDVKHCT
ncbi:MAG: TadE/TadG family type IV pilus assembly protein [Sphingorhabdus sp.]